MDASHYKDQVTSRGFAYHYYYSHAKDFNPTLLFLHGFPSTSYDWHNQIAHFLPLGYGIIVPDMLGYGGTSKPDDPAAYRASLMTKDLVEILDAEGIDKVIAIGHDWGTVVASRLHNYYPERFLAYGFLAVWYQPPSPDMEVQKVNEITKEQLGYEALGYWYFFSDDDASALIEKNWDSFASVLWPKDPAIWKTDMAPLGALKNYISAGKITDAPSYLTPEYKAHSKQTLLEDGFKAPRNWYKVQTKGFASDDDKQIPQSRYIVEKPVFYGATLEDCLCPVELGKAAVAKLCKNYTIKEYDSDHWVMLSHSAQVNKDLQEWIEGVISQSGKL